MAMIGRDAAVAEIGKKRHELDGPIAFAAWLGVHALLMSGVRERIEAFVNWAWTYFSRSQPIQVLDRSDVRRIDWDEGTEVGEFQYCAGCKDRPVTSRSYQSQEF